MIVDKKMLFLNIWNNTRKIYIDNFEYSIKLIIFVASK